MLLAHLLQFPFPGLPFVALLLQIPLAGLATAVEWNQRKKRPAGRQQPYVSRRPEAPRPIAGPSESSAPPAAEIPKRPPEDGVAASQPPASVTQPQPAPPEAREPSAPPIAAEVTPPVEAVERPELEEQRATEP
ncbi:MAG TPA: hypothetical protein VJ728_16345, partial [Candidatus Binataceae bacterium]|nr:hypothetical protein [Candidatus Binataceae bacterium]